MSRRGLFGSDAFVRLARLLVLVLATVLVLVALGPTRVRAQASDTLTRAETWLRAIATTHDDVASLTLDATWPSHSPNPAALEARLRGALPTTRDGGAEHLSLHARVEDGELALDLEIGQRERSWLARLLGFALAHERHTFRAPLDAPLRRYVAALPALTDATVVQRAYALPSRDYVALAVADLGDEGPNELVLLRANGELEVLRLSADRSGRLRLALVARASLPSSPMPGLGAPRAFGILTADDGSVIGGLRDREALFRARLVDDGLNVASLDDSLCPPGAYPLADACAMPVDARDYFASELLSRTGHVAPARAPTSFYSRARQTLHRADGTLGDVEAVVTPRGRLAVRTDDRVVGVMGHGAALGLADVDGDGQSELLASSDRLAGEGDELHLFRVRADGGLRALWRSEPLDGSVLVAGAGDLDVDGAPELLAIEEPRDPNERATLWVVR